MSELNLDELKRLAEGKLTPENVGRLVTLLPSFVTDIESLRKQLEEARSGKWNYLTDDDRKWALESQPDMLDGFMKTWGWLHFAKAIEQLCMEKNAALRSSVDADIERAMLAAVRKTLGTLDVGQPAKESLEFEIMNMLMKERK